MYTKIILPNFFQKLWQRILPEGEYGKGAALLIGSTALGQGLLVISFPVLSRLYDPQALGQMGLFTSFITVASVLLALRYEAAIVAAKNVEDAVGLFMLSIKISLVNAVIFSGLFFLLIQSQLFGFGQLQGYSAILMFIGLIFMALYQALRYLLLRGEAHFKLLSKVNLYQNILRVCTQVGFGFFGAGYMGLIVGDLAGRAAGIYKMLQRSMAIFKSPDVNRHHLLDIAKKNKEYPLYSLSSTLIDTLAFSLPIPLIAQTYGLTAAGMYTIVNRILALPLVLISANIADVFYSQFAVMVIKEPDKATSLFYATIKKLFLLGIVPLVMIAALSPGLLGIILGHAWKEAGILATVLVPWTFAQLVISPVSRIIFVIGGQATKFIYDIAALLAVAGGIFLGHYLHFTFIAAMGMVSGLNVIAYLLYFLILKNLLKSKGY